MPCGIESCRKPAVLENTSTWYSSSSGCISFGPEDSAWVFTAAGAAITAMRRDTSVRGSLRLRAGAAWYAAELAQRTGRIADAENEARLALDLTPDDVNLFTGGAIEILLWALAERGEVKPELAAEAFAKYRIDDPTAVADVKQEGGDA